MAAEGLTLQLTYISRDRTRIRGRIVRGGEEWKEVEVHFRSRVPRGIRRRSIVRVWAAADPDGRLTAYGEPNPVVELTEDDLRVLAEHNLSGMSLSDIAAALDAAGVRTLTDAARAHGADRGGFLAAVAAAVGRDAAAALDGFLTSVRTNVELWPLVEMLRDHGGLDVTAALKIYDFLAHRAARNGRTVAGMVRDDPWLIAQVEGITMGMADALAEGLGVSGERAARNRLEGLIMSIVWQETREGHAWTDRRRLYGAVAHHLRGEPEEKIGQLFNELILGLASLDGYKSEKGAITPFTLTDGTRAIYLAGEFFSERHAIEAIKVLMKTPPTPSVSPRALADAARAVARGILGSGGDLSPEQINAVTALSESRIVAVPGWAGTGKTALVAALVGAFHALFGEGCVRITAPTALAALRAGTKAGVALDALGTMHRAVLYLPEESDLAVEPPRKRIEAMREAIRGTKLLVVDEAGMAPDGVLAQLLMMAAGVPECRVLLVGDPGQCPSILPGGVFDALASHPHFASVRRPLAGIRRTDRPVLLENFRRIREGRALLAQRPGEWEIVDVADEEAALDAVRQVVGEDPEAMVIAPMYAGLLGVDRLNGILRGILSPDAAAHDGKFAPGDRVIALRNDYGSAEGGKDVLNGLTGTVVSADGESVAVRYAYPDGTTCLRRCLPAEADRLIAHAYALTPWKAQGGEADTVVLVLSEETAMSAFDRRVLYTAVTRARKRVVMVGPGGLWEKVIGRDGKRRSGMDAQIAKVFFGLSGRKGGRRVIVADEDEEVAD